MLRGVARGKIDGGEAPPSHYGRSRLECCAHQREGAGQGGQGTGKEYYSRRRRSARSRAAGDGPEAQDTLYRVAHADHAGARGDEEDAGGAEPDVSVPCEHGARY